LPERAIGVFDSGVGGLTVFKELMRLLPEEDLVYLGDTARVPYGTKSADTVRRYSLEAASFLVSQGIKALVVACNTASSVALPTLQEHFDIPVIGVIEPGARRAVELTRCGMIGVIGTEGTVKSGAYTRAIQAVAPELQIASAACPLFVPLAEEGWANHEVARLTAREYLAPLVAQGIDALVLGCTHYPLLKSTLTGVLGREVLLVDSAEETANCVVQKLESGDMLRSAPGGARRFFVTDVPTRFERVGGAFLGASLENVTQVAID